MKTRQELDIAVRELAPIYAGNTFYISGPCVGVTTKTQFTGPSAFITMPANILPPFLSPKHGMLSLYTISLLSGTTGNVLGDFCDLSQTDFAELSALPVRVGDRKYNQHVMHVFAKTAGEAGYHTVMLNLDDETMMLSSLASISQRAKENRSRLYAYRGMGSIAVLDLHGTLLRREFFHIPPSKLPLGEIMSHNNGDDLVARLQDSLAVPNFGDADNFTLQS